MSQIFEGFNVDTDKEGWSDVMYFYTVRDRTMHPTNLDSLKISKNDIEKCDKGRVWLENVFIDLGCKLHEKTKA